MMRLNCWEYMGCGREAGGERVHLLGACPASVQEAYDGTNHGKAAGRFCWTIEGTLCPGHGNERVKRCLLCPFLQQVAREEGASFRLGVGTPCHGDPTGRRDPDAAERKQMLAQCRPFEELLVTHDPRDPAGPDTVRVRLRDGRPISVLRPEVAREIISGMKEGYTYSAFVKSPPNKDEPAEAAELLIVANDPGFGAAEE